MYAECTDIHQFVSCHVFTSVEMQPQCIRIANIVTPVEMTVSPIELIVITFRPLCIMSDYQ